ncbi:MAG: thiol:disulfide interchange protein DsbA/DsbL [Candidatus Accumulibacter sp.]|jgi:thiol:disulfide interchange protein DsbA|uniref:thiol:disulfide interchange protein DsbA/DsbL n=1 Tax=Accumulibacter sp. TaxID=2053492 RepID=UPI001A44E4A5|nr:thiol:disulfide interchange protein DsbA/DsbL [Accumulibacter sp.]MBL8394888.1 thiol:disulfide interchange protein DsbA/DsbL [Accumulibacter sp.]
MQLRISGWVLAVILAMLATLPARAQLAVGRDYVPIVPAQLTDNPAKIEVLEFFSYGCPHCSEFHPIVSKWSSALPADVVFKRVPVSFGRPQWATLAKLFYALEASGDLTRLDAAVFDALHKKGARLYDDKSVIDWVTAQGIDGKKFADAYNSFGVISKVKRADQMAQSYKIQGVPAMAVDGKYLVTGKEIKGLPDLVLLTDQVIDLARRDRSKK